MSKPSYFAILPSNVRYDKSLSSAQKIMYAEITALTNKDGYCFAKNSYFAKLYGVTRETVSRWVSQLENRGYIKLVLNRNDSQQIQRKIYIVKDADLLTKTSHPIDENVNTPIDKNVNTPIDKNVTYNNTSINNTSMNNGHFEKFWDKYPKKVAKKKAKSIFEKLKESEQLEAIKGIYKVEQKDKKYIPHPTTYLNQARWEDEIETEEVNYYEGANII